MIFKKNYPTELIKKMAQFMMDDLNNQKKSQKEHFAIHAGKELKCNPEINTLENLYTIMRWKSHRRADLIKLADKENTILLLKKALSANQASDAIDVLRRIPGVGVPMASAIMTMIDPERYTVIDVRALKSLGDNKKRQISAKFYQKYLDFCIQYVEEIDFPPSDDATNLRLLDKALFFAKGESIDEIEKRLERSSIC